MQHGGEGRMLSLTIVARRKDSFHPPPSERVREQVRDWLPIFEALLPDRRFRRAGRYVVTNCPFHHPDRNPSFGIRADTGRWTCFAGCGSGDAFDLAMKLLGISFGEAVRLVADLAGVPLDPPRRRSVPPGRWGTWR